MIAQRAGSSGGTPIVILAHRDAHASGAEAELSGTAALIELARVFAARETQRTIVLVSTSGGSGGDAGALNFATEADPSAPPQARSTRQSCSETSPGGAGESLLWSLIRTPSVARPKSCSAR